MNLPKVTIKDEAKARQVNTKSGPRTVHYQVVQVETANMRIQVDREIDTKADALPVGKEYEWDVVDDLVPGSYSSVDLARRMTLREVSASRTPK